jgi:hypothetical protein
MEAANTGMLGVSEGASPDEVISAYVSMACHAVEIAKEKGASMEPLRQAVMALLMRCTDADARMM